ncbi:hypothetical protein AAHE18_14G109200 [Arachis hypogaea]
MEFEVKLVAAIDNCFVSLPLPLIQTLQSTRSSPLPHILALELRSPTHPPNLWFVAWSGATSSSPSVIEVSKQFAECISLPNHGTVQVRAASNVAHASLVTIEPHTEDDWEVLELNSEQAEAAILNQVRIVHEGMRFPLWLHGHTVITFHVTSVFPKKAVVQLMPGTEVAVAPKRRNRLLDSAGDSHLESCDKEQTAKMLLRIQDPGPVSLVPRISKENANISKTNVLKSKGGSTGNEVENGNLTDKKQHRQAVVHLLFSESVAAGHVMLAKSLRLYLRAGLHTWVYLKAYDIIREKSIPSITFSPCQFKLLKQDSSAEKDGLDGHNNHMNGKLLAKSMSEEENANQSQNQKGIKSLVRLWYIAQLEAITSITGVEVNSLVMCSQTLLDFKLNCYNLGDNGRAPLPYNSSENSGKTAEVLFILTFGDEHLHHGKPNAYKVALGKSLKSINIGDLQLFEGMKLGDPVSIHSIEETASQEHISSNVSLLSWMEKPASDIINRILVLLSLKCGLWFGSCNLPLPGHVLVHGPPGSGKTSLSRAVAKSLENHKDILAHIVFVPCSKLSLEKVPIIRQELTNHVMEALNHAPSIVIFDDLDSIISTSDSEGSQPSTSVAGLSDILVNIIDEYREKRQKSCGFGPVAFIASIQSLEKLPQSLSSSGRFDFHIQLPAPAASERKAMLKHEIERRHLQCGEDILLDVAVKCDGYDGYDLEILVDRAVHAAVHRFLPSNAANNEHESPALLREDFSQAMHGFLPVAMRDITKSASDDGRSGWDDVGGLVDIRNAIKEMIELPSKFPKTFAQAPLRLRSNVLLYGPPGCGKTHIVGAAAAASSLRFISVKGPELLNKYIGASEQAVRDIFSKAAAAAPCLLFFDEFDSIAPKRGHDNTGVTDRVVNQFLTELDGVEILTGVFVFAATSRPDLLDAALLRPGRLDRLLFCDFPSWHERLEILTVLSRKLPMAHDIDLATVAKMTEGFSGADLQALLSDAQLAAVHEVLDNLGASAPGKAPVITDALLKANALKARPSVSEEEKRRLYSIYGQFLDSKRSVAAQSRDAKGKRATLA